MPPPLVNILCYLLMGCYAIVALPDVRCLSTLIYAIYYAFLITLFRSMSLLL